MTISISTAPEVRALWASKIYFGGLVTQWKTNYGSNFYLLPAAVRKLIAVFTKQGGMQMAAKP
jgi:hypothetical protein